MKAEPAYFLDYGLNINIFSARNPFFQLDLPALFPLPWNESTESVLAIHCFESTLDLDVLDLSDFAPEDVCRYFCSKGRNKATPTIV